MSTTAQRDVHHRMLTFVSSHPEVAVRVTDRTDGSVDLFVHSADDGVEFATRKRAVDELGALFGANSHPSNADRYAAVHVPASDEPRWVLDGGADVTVWALRSPVRECPACRQYPCKCAKPKPGTGNGRGA